MSAFRMTGRLRRNMYYGGGLTIIEPVTLLNTPVARQVCLIEQVSGIYVQKRWSEATTGNVTFDHLAPGPWVLYALDHTGAYEAVAISDRIATLDGERP